MVKGAVGPRGKEESTTVYQAHEEGGEMKKSIFLVPKTAFLVLEGEGEETLKGRPALRGSCGKRGTLLAIKG